MTACCKLCALRAQSKHTEQEMNHLKGRANKFLSWIYNRVVVVLLRNAGTPVSTRRSTDKQSISPSVLRRHEQNPVVTVMMIVRVCVCVCVCVCHVHSCVFITLSERRQMHQAEQMSLQSRLERTRLLQVNKKFFVFKIFESIYILFLYHIPLKIINK